MNKIISKSILMIFIMSVLFVLFTGQIYAKENSSDNIDDRIKLIQASQKLQEEKDGFYTNDFTFFLTDYGTEGGEMNLGMKVELNFPEKVIKNKKANYKYVIEGIYLKDEGKMSSFFSVERIFVNMRFSPYFGLGLELTGRAEYQVFTGLNILNSFYVESKYINEKENNSEFYSSAGYKINF